MLCLKKRRTYSFTQGACTAHPRLSKKNNNNLYEGSLNTAITTLPRKNRSREERTSRMVLTVTEDTPADMLAGSMELLVQLPRDHHLHTERVTVLRSTPMMDLLVQIATAHKLTASSYTLQAIGERGLVLPHHPNTPIGALDALQVKLLPKQGTCAPRKTKQTNQPFETTFRLQVHLPRNQLYVSRVSPKMNLGEILDEVCREKNLDRNKYELRHPVNLEEILDLALCLQDYHLQEVTLYTKQTRSLGPTLSTQDIMALQRQEERRRQQTKQSVFGFMFKKSKENSLSTDSLGGRSVSPARSDETGRSASPLQPPARPQRKRRPAPKPPTDAVAGVQDTSEDNNSGKDKMTINHSRNSSDSSGYHEASVLSDNPDSAARLPETLPRRSKAPGMSDPPRKLAHTSQSSKSLSNLALTGDTLSRGISSTSLSSAGLRKKRAAPPPPAPRPLSSAISTQALERIVDSEESLTSDIDPSKPPSDIGAPSKASSDIDCPKANSDIGVSTKSMCQLDYKSKQEKTTTCEFDVVNIQQKSAVKANVETCSKPDSVNHKLAKRDPEMTTPVEATSKVEQARVAVKKVGEPAPLPKPRKLNTGNSTSEPPTAPKRKVAPPLPMPRVLNTEFNGTKNLSHDDNDRDEHTTEIPCIVSIAENTLSSDNDDVVPLVNTKEKINQEEKALETVNNSIVHGNALLRSDSHLNGEKESDTEVNPASENETNKQEKIISDKSSNRNSELHSDSIEPNVSSEGSLSLECEITSGSKDNNNFSEQDDRTLNAKYDDSHDQTENQLYNLYTSFDGVDRSPNENWMKPDRVTEQRNGQLEILQRQTVCQRPPSMLRKTVCKSAENIEAARNVHPEDTTNGITVKSDIEENRKEVCTVISTIPKCERLDDIKEDSILKNNTINRDIVATDQNNYYTTKSIDESPVQYHSTMNEQNAEITESINNIGKNVKRSKRIFRSQSNSDDFETDLLMKQRRYLTSNNIVYALNFNLSALNSGSHDTTEIGQEQTPVGHDIKRTRDLDVDKGESYGNFATVKEDTPSETDILLQKVSDTLSSALPTSSSPVPSDPSLPLKTNCNTATSIKPNVIDSSTKSETTVVETKNESNKVSKPCVDFPIESTLDDSSTPNITVGSQQDTSDYVSAMSEDLSISDWEYQLPAPPSAFRDTHSPTIDGYDTITLRSVEAFKEPLVNPVLEPIDATDSNCDKNAEPGRNILLNNSKMHLESIETTNSHNNIDHPVKNLSGNSEVQLEKYGKPSNKKTNFISEAEIDIKRVTTKPIVKQASMTCRKPEDNLRKEVISELETKIEMLPQSVNKEFDRRVMNSEKSAPQIAPVDNTLSNFTITTYTKQKSLDIYDEIEQPDHYTKNSNDKFIKTFATLSRNNSSPANYDNKNMGKNAHLTNGSISHDKKATNKLDDLNVNNTEFNQVVRPKIYNQDGSLHRWQSSNATNEKTNIQRSKSYISMSSNIKYQTNGNNEKKYELHDESNNSQIKKASSITNLNIDVGRTNEKFSQWRDNMLKRQEEPTKEKQLQSIQVLKSILPQLKNAQQTEENVLSKEYNSAILIEKKHEARSNEHSNKTNVVSTRESRESSNKQLSREESTKRYTYAGPPAINLGSWSERPSVNVQIKMDTDYKLGMNNVSGNRTIVNINSVNDEKQSVNYTRDIVRDDVVKKENKMDFAVNKNTDELAKKLITHTTASCFKKPLLNKINMSDPMKNEDKPIVTGVELKKTFVQMREMPKNIENEIDTTPVNFKELTKTFGQHLSFKPKSNRVNVNRHSVDFHDLRANDMEEITDSSIKQNGHAKFTKISSENDCALKSQSLLNGIQQNSRTKRFTSIVGIYPTDQNNGSKNDITLRNNVNSTKINPPMPIVKGFKISTSDSKKNNNQVNHNGLSITDDSRKDIQPPKPPTMPVITGVTLKNTRPKSMPVQIDQRDMLLESIRNFGGRKKLKNVAEKY